MNTERMTRPRLRLVGGVCAGFAEHTGLPVSAVRTVTLLLALCGGAGALLYAWLWVTTPSEISRVAGSGLPKASLARASGRDSAVGGASSAAAPSHFAWSAAGTRPQVLNAASHDANAVTDGAAIGAAATGVAASDAATMDAALPHAVAAGPGLPDGAPADAAIQDVASARSAPVTEILLGLALLAAGTTLVASRLGADIPLAVVIPAIVVLAGVALAWRQFADIRSGAAQSSSALMVRTLGALVLVAVGILLFFVTGDAPNVWTVIVAAVSVLLGVAVVIAPWFIRLSNDLAEERAARVREMERAEIAAHLHDSVLQTLALIQQKAGPHSDAARLARAQERELREWLFTGVGERAVDLAAELRRIAGVIEHDFAVHFELVTAGAVSDDAPDALVAAAREAMLNAARHAGGTVSVYLESGAGGTSLSVTDRGPGFSLDDIPEDRLGVRESILGRMRRVGGSAAVRPGPGGSGTEILLTLPAAAAGVGNAGAGAGVAGAADQGKSAMTDDGAGAGTDQGKGAMTDDGVRGETGSPSREGESW
ncbi:ATP-binding protein [Glaciibacter superstes]|uniref:ATP-binding protein n=1 Tax=Glaciibacter superstes TaxID=501023 RepID=UPI0003B4F52B|nr:ATP-binding protein [Glaciibacter superstes]